MVVQCPGCGRKNRVPAVGDGLPHCGACHCSLPWLAEAGDDTFAEVVEAAKIPAVVDFRAAWCGPCRIISPALEHVAEHRAGLIKLVKVNVDEATRTAERFAIKSIPALMVVRDGRVIAVRCGAVPEYVLEEWIDDVLARI
ncbi:thiol reductase thioredoxin [Acrocarpospora corrugata]|uniref:Thioredoxin n=1 Tax=Acrocarpospora corrugata TaxID=35763 RepID=A0A5M3VRK8_9ACTN|nr:thioredoxin [Acrocarpospora corrugata]GER99436.1 thiol reductase thioredoxin [Acrocarpospora corrugata]